MRRHCLYSLIIYGYIHPMTDLTAFVCRVFAAVEISLSTLCPELLFSFLLLLLIYVFIYWFDFLLKWHLWHLLYRTSIVTTSSILSYT